MKARKQIFDRLGSVILCSRSEAVSSHFLQLSSLPLSSPGLKWSQVILDMLTIIFLREAKSMPLASNLASTIHRR